MVKGRDAEDTGRREAQFARNLFEDRRGQTAVKLLRGVQDFDQRIAGVMVARHDFFEQFLRTFSGYFGDFGHHGGVVQVSGQSLSASTQACDNVPGADFRHLAQRSAKPRRIAQPA
jgi:hypothetical protein